MSGSEVGSGSAGYFSPATFAFLRDLAENNTREWFRANRSRYEETVREPALRFIVDFAPHLGEVSPHFRADPRTQGGSLFRIYRDIRFARDKRPFKTHTGIQFRHDARNDVHAPGFYLHLEPGACFAAMGIWHPDGKTLKAIRETLVERPDAWRAVISSPTFAERFSLSGDRLSRAPRGFDPRDSLIEDLKWKDFVAVADLSECQVVAPGFLQAYAVLCHAGAAFMAFLCRALELPF